MPAQRRDSPAVSAIAVSRAASAGKRYPSISAAPRLTQACAAGHIGGIDAEYAWSQPGGSGNGITLVDIERGWKLADAIQASTDALVFGDVMLLELQVEQEVPDSDPILLPVEFEPANYEVVRLATALGIVVVEAVGNNQGIGGQDLATHIDSLGNHIFDKDNEIEYKDSGAILVAAANPLINPALRMPESNYGNRVNCFAWGDFVKTLDVDASGNDAYTDSFGSTSAASAIVAGAAILVQAIAEQDPAISSRFNPFIL